MHEPRPWPYDDPKTWQVWRDHLDHLQVPHIAALKREADAELARIARCLEGPHARAWMAGKPRRAHGAWG
jgi:hypothetical protein